MTEKKLISTLLRKNIIFTFVIFLIIFSILGTTLYFVVQGSIYESSDRELLSSQNQKAFKNNNNNRFDKKLEEKQNEKPNEKPDDIKIVPMDINPRIIYIVRDSNGSILENEFNSDRYSDVEFDKTNLNTIYEYKLNGKYSYRCINYKIEENGEASYIQFLINVDAENQILDNFRITLITSIAITILASLIASYILSKKTLKPIVENWRKHTEFVQNASHELRTPLTIIQAKQELLLENPESKIEDNVENISISLSETRRLTKLTKELMALARADSSKLEINRRDIDVNKLVSKVAEPFKEMAEIEDKEIELDLKYSKTAKLDESKIHELLVIVIDNAMKYTEKGDKINISTKEEGGKLVIDVADTGIGISDEAIDHVFERFYREDKARSRKTGGSGLGLSLANTIVEAHGGTIKAKHNSPKGTIIEIRI